MGSPNDLDAVPGSGARDSEVADPAADAAEDSDGVGPDDGGEDGSGPGDDDPDDDDTDDDDTDDDDPDDDDTESDSDDPDHEDTGTSDASEPPADTSVPILPTRLPTTLGGAYEDVAAPLWASGRWEIPPASSSGPLPSWASIVAGDVDGDDDPELFVWNVFDRSVPVAAQRPGRVFTWRRAGEVIEERESLARRIGASFSWVMGVLDVDGDGRNDLLRSSYAGPNLEFGRGNGTFEAYTIPGLADAALPSPKGITVADVDLDGWLDLVYANNSCQGSSIAGAMVARRTGLRTWERDQGMVERRRGIDPYAVLVFWLPEGTQAIAMIGHGCTVRTRHPGFARWSGRGPDGFPRYVEHDPLPLDATFRLMPMGFGLMYSDLAPMGATTLDVDLDGRLDLVTSSTPDNRRLMVMTGTGTATFADRSVRADVRPQFTGWEPADLPWGIVPVDFDRDGRPDLAVTHGDDAGQYLLGSQGGPYYTQAYWNDGTGAFTEVTDALGLWDVPGNWQSLAVSDLDGDLDADLLVGGYGHPPAVLRDLTEPVGRHLAIRLRGTTSNHLGIGAVLEVEAPGLPRQVRLVGENGSPWVVADPLVRFGLGERPEARTVRVRWPSGTVQELRGLAADQLHVIEEPPVITLGRRSRHAPADGATTITVTVTPRAPDGTLRSAGAVTVEAIAGPGTWAGPVVAGADGWTRTLVAPQTPGSTAIEVTIDGVPVPIVPRVWWDEVTAP